MPLICENFSLGFGGKETKINSLEPEIKLYQYFKDFLNINIAWMLSIVLVSKERNI